MFVEESPVCINLRYEQKQSSWEDRPRKGDSLGKQICILSKNAQQELQRSARQNWQGNFVCVSTRILNGGFGMQFFPRYFHHVLPSKID